MLDGVRAIVVIACTAGLIACDRVYGLDGRSDGASPSGDAPLGDAPPGDAPCTGEFITGLISPLPDFRSNEVDPVMSANGLELFYTQIVSPNGRELFSASRTSTAAPFTISPLAPLNSPDDESDPTLTADGLTLLFVSTRSPGGTRVWQSTRTGLGAEWQPPVLVTGITVSVSSITISHDGLTLYVMDGDTDTSTLFRFRRLAIDQMFAQETAVGTGARFPSVNATGDTVYFHRGAPNVFTLMRMTRNSSIDQFENPKILVDGGSDPSLSFDGQTLLFHYGGGLATIQRACAAAQ
jgi:hypothetical protein